MLVRCIFVECVSKIKSVLLIIFQAIYGAYLWWLCEYVYFILLSSSNRMYHLFAIVCG